MNLGSDHPSIIEAIVKGQEERRDHFPRIITCPNEMVALSMADGYARLTGKPQCVIVVNIMSFKKAFNMDSSFFFSKKESFIVATK